MNHHERIVWDPGILGGEPVIKGTRVTLRTILVSLAEGATIKEIIEDFPTLSEEDVLATIAFAAAVAQEDLLRKNASRPDADNPEWTEGDIRRARPLLEVLPKEAVEAIRRARGQDGPAPTTSGPRGS